ncbi:MAG TPA: ATP-dependent DNA helicase [Bacteroidetes bacterium]|nr:ATP-dependent DNA helicase [Bacteroidota bacterium]
MNFLDELNEMQRKAVESTEGPVMIVAGPGSGKTRVLTYRIAHLLNQQIDAFNILALTFTNKAAAEMRERIEKLTNTEARNLYMGTFHSVFARLLRYDAERIGFPSNFSIYDTDDSRSLLKSIIKELALNDSLYKPNVVHNRISSAKNSLVGPEEYQKDYNIQGDDSSSGRPRIGEIYEIYQRRLQQAGAMDFDDLLFKMHFMLEKFPDILYKYQRRFRYILIDEFQDTNFAQYSIVKKLGDMHQNICVVGDDAQSIYSFRGATIANILNFERDYPEVQVFKLEQNYRSTQHIVNAANKVIEQNKLQITKQIWTENHAGEKIKLFRALSDNDEGRLIADSIFEEKMRHQRHHNEFAILYRTNAQSRAFEEALRRLNIPYIIYGGLSFYQRKEIKDMVAYLRLGVNHYDEEALKRVINYPARGIGQTTLDKAMVVATEKNIRLWDVFEKSAEHLTGNRSNSNIETFIYMIKNFSNQLKTMNAYEAASAIAKSSTLLKELYDDKTVEGLSRYENLQELLNGIKEFTESELPEITIDGELKDEQNKDKSLGAYLQNISLLTDADKNIANTDSVKMMTIHSAKGLEFPCVYVVGLEENLFPSQMSVNSREDLEEERRLFYVAITRAKNKLTLSCANTRYRFGSLTYCDPSRFIDEIDPKSIEAVYTNASPEFKRNNFLGEDTYSKPTQNFSQKKFPNQRSAPPKFSKPSSSAPAPTSSYQASPDFKPDDFRDIREGMEVEHQRFGIGKIEKLDGKEFDRVAQINFKDAGIKKMVLKFAKLRIMNKA